MKYRPWWSTPEGRNPRSKGRVYMVVCAALQDARLRLLDEILNDADIGEITPLVKAVLRAKLDNLTPGDELSDAGWTRNNPIIHYGIEEIPE